MPLETIISVVAILAILGLGRVGMVFGVFYELTTTLLLSFAMLVSLRYWYLVTGLVLSWMPGEPAYAAFGAYWTLFLVGCVPLITVLNRITEQSVPRYPRFVDSLLGGLLGLASATILVCCVMTSLSVALPKILPDYNRQALLVPFDRLPIDVYQHIERKWLHIPPTSPGHTRFPTFDKAHLDDFAEYWR